jgi:hypothetical protein
MHLLWQLSEALGTDLSLLIPRREELFPSAKVASLEPGMVKQIKEAANGNADTIKALTRFVSKLKATIEIAPQVVRRMTRENIENKAEQTLRETDTYRIPVAIEVLAQPGDSSRGSWRKCCRHACR